MEEFVNVITSAKFFEGSSSKVSKLLTIFLEDDSVQVDNMTTHQPKLIVEVPSHFPSNDNKMVPWNYNYNYVHKETMANISGIRGMTRNGRCYAPITARKVSPKPTKKISKKKDTCWHSGYIVVEQLNKLPTRISLLDELKVTN